MLVNEEKKTVKESVKERKLKSRWTDLTAFPSLAGAVGFFANAVSYLCIQHYSGA
jgi:hypothetical protein